jgi:hypothetical protein
MPRNFPVALRELPIAILPLERFPKISRSFTVGDPENPVTDVSTGLTEQRSLELVRMAIGTIENITRSEAAREENSTILENQRKSGSSQTRRPQNFGFYAAKES